MAVKFGSRVVPSLLVSDMRRTLEFYVQNTGGLVSTPTAVEVWDADADALIATIDLPKMP